MFSLFFPVMATFDSPPPSKQTVNFAAFFLISCKFIKDAKKFKEKGMSCLMEIGLYWNFVKKVFALSFFPQESMLKN